MSPSTVLITGASRFIGGQRRLDSRAILRSPACSPWMAFHRSVGCLTRPAVSLALDVQPDLITSGLGRARYAERTGARHAGHGVRHTGWSGGGTGSRWDGASRGGGGGRRDLRRPRRPPLRCQAPREPRSSRPCDRSGIPGSPSPARGRSPSDLDPD